MELTSSERERDHVLHVRIRDRILRRYFVLSLILRRFPGCCEMSSITNSGSRDL